MSAALPSLSPADAGAEPVNEVRPGEDFWPADDGGLNRRAFYAARGVSIDYIADLCALLRSNVEIHPIVRSAIAAALDGTNGHGSRLIMAGHRPDRDRVVAIATRQRWMEIGRFVDAQRGKSRRHGSRKIALDAASKEFGSSFEKCEEAYQYYERVKTWVGSAQVPGTYYGELSESDLEAHFHSFAADGSPPPKNINFAEHNVQVQGHLEALLAIAHRT